MNRFMTFEDAKAFIDNELKKPGNYTITNSIDRDQTFPFEVVSVQQLLDDDVDYWLESGTDLEYADWNKKNQLLFNEWLDETYTEEQQKYFSQDTYNDLFVTFKQEKIYTS